MNSPRALVVHPPMSVARDFIDYPYFSNLGAVQLAAVLRSHGCATHLVDAFALTGSGLTWRGDGRALLGATVDEVLAHTARVASPDLVVVAYTPFHRPPHRDPLLAELCGALRARFAGAPLVLADLYQSGQHYVDTAEGAVLAAYPECDAYVQYEGEGALVAIVDALPARPSGHVRGEDAPRLDALAPPAWDMIDLAAYERFHARVVERLGRGAWAFPIDGRTLPMITSRGCPFTCAHCSSNPGRAEGAPKTQRRLSPEALRAQLELLSRAHGATRVEVLDELINVNERHWESFLDATEALGLRFDAPNGMRADYLRAAHLARVRGRVTTMSVSAESGVQRVVTEVVHKRLDLADIVRVAREAHEAGVALMVHYIIGMPGETPAEVHATLAFALDLYERYRAEPAVQFATPLPGTALARGRSLPVVDDWGPRFQTDPSQPGASVSPEDLKRFRRSFEGRVEALRAPPRAALMVTHRCNNRCAFCVTGLDTADGVGLEASLEGLRAQGVTALELDGGEPTLHPSLPSLVRRARALGFTAVTLRSNARRLAYEGYAAGLIAAGLTGLCVGVQGATAGTHEKLTGDADAWAQTLHGLRNARRYGGDGLSLGVSVTLVRDNLAELGALLALAHDAGATYAELRGLAPFGEATASLAADPSALAEALRVALDAWGDRMALTVHDLPHCALPAAYARFMAGRSLYPRVTVTQRGVDWSAYRSSQRDWSAPCEGCPARLECDGFYELMRPAEPPWTRGVSLAR